MTYTQMGKNINKKLGDLGKGVPCTISTTCLQVKNYIKAERYPSKYPNFPQII